MYNKKIKIILAAAVIMIMLPFLYLTVSASDSNRNIIEIPRENCFFTEDKLMIPFRAFCETLGAVVDWDDEQYIAKAYYISESCEIEVNVFMGKKPQTYSIWDKKDHAALSINIGTGNISIYSDIPARADMTVYINGEWFPVFFSAPAVIIAGRLYIPSDVITDVFNGVLIYDWHTIKFEFTEKNIIEAIQRKTEKFDIARLINEARIKYGLSPLKYNITLDYICGMKTRDRSVYKYFGHKSPILGTPSEMVVAFTEKLRYTGECLYYCNVKVPHEKVFNAWMDSPGHKAILMSEYAKYIGINMAWDDTGGIYWALLTAR